ncbi:hypothetical protein HZB07_02125 [Candidatus Saganbacteria bacterium]|nr:hypothetical protein [Candidatus Saganbacteria bacterium]
MNKIILALAIVSSISFFDAAQAFDSPKLIGETDMIISKEFRDANPVNWGAGSDPSDWVTLN